IQKHADVDGTRIIKADQEPGNWMSHGRTYNEQRFSPLKDINAGNAPQLALAWHFDLDTDRGQEATPVVVDGVMYFTSAWSKVFALNAAPASYCGPTIRRSRVNGALMHAVTSSIEASQYGRAKCSLVRSTADWSHSMPRLANRSGKRLRLIHASGTRLPARRE